MRPSLFLSGRFLGFFCAAIIGFMTVVSASAQTGPTISGCPLFPEDNVWNTPVDNLPLDPNSSRYITAIGAYKDLHPDFGSGIWNGGPIGIPYNVVPGSQPRVAIRFEYADESDPGPYPIPEDPAVEGGSQATGDRHVLVVDEDSCMLHETWSTYPQSDGSWYAGSGAVFDLRSNLLRPAGWTSSDAAGLPVLPGLARYDEVASGEIRHALRFTAPKIRREFIWPARHYASDLTGPQYPPMGQRFRLKSGFDISGFSPDVQIILRALKKYGMVLADVGASWYISGAPDPRWNDDVLVGELRQVAGSDFEAVDESSLMINPDSGQVGQGLQFALTVQKGGAGTGDVISAEGKINCGTDCSESYAPGTEVTLTARANSSSLFSEWSGACAGTSLTCKVKIDSAKTVTAVFSVAQPPSAFVLINGGTAATKSPSVTLTLSAGGSGGVSGMCISNTPGCTAWIPFAATKRWTLTGGDGTKTVYVWFKDIAGNADLSPHLASIILDTAAPANGTVKATPGNTQTTLNWNGFSDTVSGVKSYKVVYGTGYIPSSCLRGTLISIFGSTTTSYVHTGLSNGTSYGYRVCAIDGAGNISAGAKARAMPAP